MPRHSCCEVRVMQLHDILLLRTSAIPPEAISTKVSLHPHSHIHMQNIFLLTLEMLSNILLHQSRIRHPSYNRKTYSSDNPGTDCYHYQSFHSLSATSTAKSSLIGPTGDSQRTPTPVPVLKSLRRISLTASPLSAVIRSDSRPYLFRYFLEQTVSMTAVRRLREQAQM